MPPQYVNNYEDWIDYVNKSIDDLKDWQSNRERDLEMANLRLQRLLDATLQRLGESESVLTQESGNDTSGTGKPVVGATASSLSVKTSG
jgi:hypothetical protein